MSHRIRFNQTDDWFARRVAALRGLIRPKTGDVLATSTDATFTAALANASWAEGRRLIFASTDQPESIAQIAKTRDVLVLSGDESCDSPVTDAYDRPAASQIVAEFFTSGSTGTPVSVPKTANQLFAEANYLVRRFEVTRDDVIVSSVPSRHVYGFLFSVMVPMVSQCLVVDERPQYPASVGHSCTTNGATIFVSTPAQLRVIAGHVLLPSVRIVFSSGAALQPETRRALETDGLLACEIFGSTETGGIATREAEGPWTPFEVCEVQQTDDGHLSVKSPFLEVPDEFYVCNDLIEVEGDHFHALGRSDDIIKVGGKRVSMAFIKDTILKQPGVDDCAILVQEHERIRLHAFVVARGGLDRSALRQLLLTYLDPVTLPRIHVVAELPRADLGKVSKRVLQDLLVRSDREIEVLSSRWATDTKLELEFAVHADCIYFEGHFDDFPILSGIAQLKFVETQILEAWSDLECPIRYERLKFRAPIFPDSHGKVTLTRHLQRVSFMVETQRGIHSSGDAVYGD